MMYWRFSNFLAGVLATVRFVPLALASSSEDFPIGISLGADYITSAYITENDGFVTAANVETTQAWKEFSHSLLRIDRDAKGNREYTESEVKKLLVTEFSSIREATSAKLNREVEILGITYPAYIADNGYIRSLLDAAIQTLPGMKDGTQVWPYLHSIRKANQLDNAKTLGYPAGTNIDLEDNLLLQLDYQNSLLEVSITSITTEATAVERQFRISDFGGARQVASPKKLEYLGTRVKALINEELSRPFDIPVELSDFKRITFSGDAPASEFQKIREAIIKAVPEFSDRFINSIKPRWAGAVGAARLARKHRLNPEVFRIQEQIYDTKENVHDEL